MFDWEGHNATNENNESVNKGEVEFFDASAEMNRTALIAHGPKKCVQPTRVTNAVLPEWKMLWLGVRIAVNNSEGELMTALVDTGAVTSVIFPMAIEKIKGGKYILESSTKTKTICRREGSNDCRREKGNFSDNYAEGKGSEGSAIFFA